jgi:hypothetical protein
VANHDEGNLSTGNIDPRYEQINNGTKKEEAATVTLLSPSNAVYVRRLVMWRGDETLLAEDDDDCHQNSHLAPPILPAAFETTIG